MARKTKAKSEPKKRKQSFSFEALAKVAKELWAKRGSIKENYVVDFLKSLLNWKKVPLVIYLLIDSLFVYAGLTLMLGFIFSLGKSSGEVSPVLVVILSIIIYFGTIVLSLSPLGEVILRHQNGAEEITSPEILARLEPIFNEVYAKAKAKFPKEISKDIKLYIQYEESPNAFAMGRNTIAVTSGLLALPDDQIKAILGHEFGHLAHKDTDLLLVMNITCKFVHMLFIVINVIMVIYQIIVRFVTIIAASFMGDGMCTLVDSVLGFALDIARFVFVTLVEAIWNIIGNIVLSISSHEGEYQADAFSHSLGYGEDLISFFKTLPDVRTQSLLKRLKAMATVGSTHPETWKRIEKLQALGKSVEMRAAIGTSVNGDRF